MYACEFRFIQYPRATRVKEPYNSQRFLLLKLLKTRKYIFGIYLITIWCLNHNCTTIVPTMIYSLQVSYFLRIFILQDIVIALSVYFPRLLRKSTFLHQYYQLELFLGTYVRTYLCFKCIYIYLLFIVWESTVATQ